MGRLLPAAGPLVGSPYQSHLESLGPVDHHANMHDVMRLCMYDDDVPKTVQIRDLDDEVYARLARRAAEAGVSVPELLRVEAVRLAARPTVEDWLKRTRRRSAPVGRIEVLTVLDEQRGVWPGAGG